MDLGHQLWVRDVGIGWVIDRTSFMDPDLEQALCFMLGEWPLLLPDAYSAKLLAQACHPCPPSGFETIAWL